MAKQLLTGLGQLGEAWLKGQVAGLGLRREMEQQQQQVERQARQDAIQKALSQSQMQTAALNRQLATEQGQRAELGFETPEQQRTRNLTAGLTGQRQTFELGTELTQPGYQQLLGLLAAPAQPYLREAATGVPEQAISLMEPAYKLGEAYKPKAPDLSMTVGPPAANVPLAELARPLERPAEKRAPLPALPTKPLDVLALTSPLTGIGWQTDPYGRPVPTGQIPTRPDYEYQRLQRQQALQQGRQGLLQQQQALRGGELDIQRAQTALNTANESYYQLVAGWPAQVAKAQDEATRRQLAIAIARPKAILADVQTLIYEQQPEALITQGLAAAHAELAILRKEAELGLPREKFPSTVITEYGPRISAVKKYEVDRNLDVAETYTAPGPEGRLPLTLDDVKRSQRYLSEYLRNDDRWTENVDVVVDQIRQLLRDTGQYAGSTAADHRIVLQDLYNRRPEFRADLGLNSFEEFMAAIMPTAAGAVAPTGGIPRPLPPGPPEGAHPWSPP